MTPRIGLLIVLGSCHSPGSLSPSSHMEALVQSERVCVRLVVDKVAMGQD